MTRSRNVADLAIRGYFADTVIVGVGNVNVAVRVNCGAPRTREQCGRGLPGASAVSWYTCAGDRADRASGDYFANTVIVSIRNQ